MLKMVLGGAAAMALLAGSAQASTSIQFYSFGAGAPAYPLITNFSSDTANESPTEPHFSGEGVVLNSTSGNGAEPAVGLGVYGTGNYLSVEGGESETFSFGAGIKHVALYIGSLDGYNGLSFLVGGNPIAFDGNDLAAKSGADNGAQTVGNTNGVFVFNFDAPVSQMTMTSGANSFEIASISAGVPEPASWALMMGGLGLIGGALRARRKQEVQAAVA